MTLGAPGPRLRVLKELGHELLKALDTRSVTKTGVETPMGQQGGGEDLDGPPSGDSHPPSPPQTEER